MSPSSIAAASDTTTASVAKDVPSLQKDFTEFWIAATRVVRLKRGQIDIDIAKKVSELMRAIVSANGRLGQDVHPGRKDKRQVSLRVYGLLVKGVCVLFSRKADLILKRCDNVMAKFRETLRSTKGITGGDGSDEEATAGAKRKRKQRKRKEKPVEEEEEEEEEERNVRRQRAGSEHPTSVTDSVPTRLADTPPASDDEERRRNDEDLIESGEVVGNSQLPMLTSAELRELSVTNGSDRGAPPSLAGDAPPLDELMTPSAQDDVPPPSVASPESVGPEAPLPSSQSSSVPPARRARAKRRASSGGQRRPKRTRLDRQIHISQAEYDQWVSNDEPITRTREMQWRPADYIRTSPAPTRLDFLGPDLTRSIEEGSFAVGVWGGGQDQQQPITPNDDMEVDELRDQLDATELEEAFMEPPTPLDTTVNGGRQERVSLLSDVFARTPQSPSEPATPHSQEAGSLNTAHAEGKFPPTHLSMETLRASIDPNTQHDQRGGLKGFDSHTFAFKNLIRSTIARQEAAGESENPKAVAFSTLAPSGPGGAFRDLAVKSLYHTLLLAAHGEIDAKQASPFGAITLTIQDPAHTIAS